MIIESKYIDLDGILGYLKGEPRSTSLNLHMNSEIYMGNHLPKSSIRIIDGNLSTDVKFEKGSYSWEKGDTYYEELTIGIGNSNLLNHESDKIPKGNYSILVRSFLNKKPLISTRIRYLRYWRKLKFLPINLEFDKILFDNIGGRCV